MKISDTVKRVSFIKLYRCYQMPLNKLLGKGGAGFVLYIPDEVSLVFGIAGPNAINYQSAVANWCLMMAHVPRHFIVSHFPHLFE